MDRVCQLIHHRKLSSLVIGWITILLYQLTTESSKKHFYGHSLRVLHFTCLLAYLLKAALLVRALTLDHHLGRGRKNWFNGVYFSILIMSSPLLSLTVPFFSFSSVYLQFHHLLLTCQDIRLSSVCHFILFIYLHWMYAHYSIGSSNYTQIHNVGL